jgi:hypothetical protein
MSPSPFSASTKPVAAQTVRPVAESKNSAPAVGLCEINTLAGAEAAVRNATDSHPVAPRYADPRLNESDLQQVADLAISSHRE